MKRIIVTGATSGIGEEIACQLGRAGAALVLGCRDVGKGEQVAARILAEGGTTDVVVLPFDAASRHRFRMFSRAYRQRFDRLDVLVNNAGLGHGQRLETPEGLELVFATNVLGYHRLSLALSDLLVRSAPSRIVVVASTFAEQPRPRRPAVDAASVRGAGGLCAVEGLQPAVVLGAGEAAGDHGRYRERHGARLRARDRPVAQPVARSARRLPQAHRRVPWPRAPTRPCGWR